MFQFAGFASHSYEFTVRYRNAVGFPIRKSSDQSLLAAPRSLSQRATSFVASQCQGIHQTPFSYLFSQNRRTQRAARRPIRYGQLHEDTLPRIRTSSMNGRDARRQTIRPIHDVQELPRGKAPAGGLCPGSAVPALPQENPGGGERIRTDDLLLAKQALSQLSYTPENDGGPG